MRNFLVILSFCFLSQLNAQNVGINEDGSNPDPSAILHLKSNTKGLLVPSMSSTDRLNIASPQDGLMVYDITLGLFFFYDSFESEWKTLYSSGRIQDFDRDTRVWVERTDDSDQILFEMANTSYWRMDGAQLENLNSGNSLFIGENAGENEDLQLRSNTFLGFQAGELTVDGSFNTFLGESAGQANTSGNDNTFLGQQAGVDNDTGNENIYIGRRTGFVQTTGDQNVYLGTFTASNKSGGSENTILGAEAGTNNGTGSGNVFLGYKAGFSESGSDRLYIHNSSSNNPLIYGEFDSGLLQVNGDFSINGNYTFPPSDGSTGQALITDGTGNISFGKPGGLADEDSDTRIEVEESSDEDIIRFYVNGTEQLNLDGDRIDVDQVHIGSNSGGNSNDDSSIYIGENAGSNYGSGAKSNVVVGTSAQNISSTAEEMVAIGFDSGAGNSAVAIGTTANASELGVAIGWQASNGGLFCTAVGATALAQGFGNSNTAIGYGALAVCQSSDNTAVGKDALDSNTGGFNNTAVGSSSLDGNTNGDRNTAIGVNALSAFGHIGNDNTAVGEKCMNTVKSGILNTGIGQNADALFDNLTNATALGANAVVMASNQVVVGDNNVISIGGYANWTNFSDGRFKTSVEEDVAGLDFILKLRPVTYNLDLAGIDRAQNREASYRNEEKLDIRYTGFIAQEVETAAEESDYDFSGVETPQNEQDFYGLRYASFTAPLVKAVQEQQEMIDLLLQKIEALEKEVQALKE